MEAMKNNLNAFYGKAFERVAKEFVVKELGLTEAKRQWGKIEGGEKGKNAYEIDMIGKKGKDVYAFEFKWEKLDRAEAVGVLNELKGKLVHVHKMPQDAKLGIVARKIEGKQKLREAGYLAYDIEDF